MISTTASSTGLLQQRPFVLFWLARLASTMGYQMLALTIGWEIYEITNSAFDLGLVGLIQFVPAVVLTLLIGHAADRYDRRLIVRVAQGAYVLAAVMMIGCARAFELPTAHALAPSLVPAPMISRAVAAWTSANQTAIICGPAMGGLIYAVSPVLVGVICLILFMCSITLISFVQAKGPPQKREPPNFASVLAGFEYIRSRRRLLGVITLDLFVVILGGATALLPIYARDILSVGPIGLGLLRSAPAVGALITSIVLARHPVARHIGRKMFAVVGSFGAATTVFGLSRWFPLSL